MDFQFRYIIEDGREIVQVNYENKWLELDDFLKDHYETKHEFIKKSCSFSNFNF